MTKEYECGAGLENFNTTSRSISSKAFSRRSADHLAESAHMIVGTLRLNSRLHGVFSLKEKRKAPTALKQKLRNSFNVAVAETEAQDSHQVLVLGVVGSQQR